MGLERKNRCISNYIFVISYLWFIFPWYYVKNNRQKKPTIHFTSSFEIHGCDEMFVASFQLSFHYQTFGISCTSLYLFHWYKIRPYTTMIVGVLYAWKCELLPIKLAQPLVNNGIYAHKWVTFKVLCLTIFPLSFWLFVELIHVGNN